MRNLMNQGNQNLYLLRFELTVISCFPLTPFDNLHGESASINNLKMDLIDNDEFKTGLTACSGIYLRFRSQS
jgi:hypothetical protein